MNNWGITKRVLRTDADLDEAVVDIQEDKSSVTENIDMTSDVGMHEEVEAQLNTLNQAPGKVMYEQWMQSERAKDDAAMAKILANTAIRSTLTAQYQLILRCSRLRSNGSYGTLCIGRNRPRRLGLYTFPVGSQAGSCGGNPAAFQT